MSSVRQALFSAAVIGAVAVGSAGVEVAPKLIQPSAHVVRPASDVEIMLPGGHGLGSGVYIGNGIVVTAGHVIDDIKESATKDNLPPVADVILDEDGVQGAHVQAKIYWRSDKSDIGAVQLLAPIDITPAKLADRDAKIGEHIELVGNPLGISFVHFSGKVAGVARDIDVGTSDGGSAAWHDAVPIDVELASGDSGGPVYDANGDVIGIAVGAVYNMPLGHVNLMISSKEAVEGMPVAQAHSEKDSIPD